ncbi:MAG TPA: glutamine--tRNA ligase/YqeY domain fusion protein [Bacteroidales bacterium]|nr:glutamine--tRNA ligase/YqeY domain fusion protein [Bacteroidales bacterium]HQL69310.1 glutamine--tRNA ligase/YqeY domain fusion protein [Bacteroidales bacterium]
MSPENTSLNFIEQIVDEDLKSGKHSSIITRFPPEPNGYLHIGHAKSICLNFGLKRDFNGKTNLRFDDTNPTAEDVEYVNSIMEDVRWLGFEWDKLFYASDYFGQLYDWAVQLIQQGKAYVDEQTPDEISRQRTNPTEPGIESPFRNRPVAENLAMFERMKNGEFENGSMVLRAKIDMNSPNMHMRDPIMYRILKQHHHRTGDAWCIYPMYDYAHGQSDYIEGITHSICTLEFEVHRPLYDWFLDQIIEGSYRPRQIEFARLNLSYTVMSKRKLLELVKGAYVNGWDDPRLPTISGLRRRGYTPESIRNFAERIGVAKRENVIDVGLLEYCVREDLNKKARRFMAVLDPVKVVITNYPDNQIEPLEAVNNPEEPEAGTRIVEFGREIWIEHDDFQEIPHKDFFRLSPGKEVRLRYAYFLKCESVIKNDDGSINTILCTYDPESKGGKSPDGRKVKSTIHWVSAAHARDIEVRLYDRLFSVPNPDDVPEGGDFKDFLNPDSLTVIRAKAETAIAEVQVSDKIQFERKGYFCCDPDSSNQLQVFNRVVDLKDTWAKLASK